MAQQGPSITGPALSALAKDTGNKGAGSNARQIDLSSHCTPGALSPEQDPGLAYSGTQRRGPFPGVSRKWPRRIPSEPQTVPAQPGRRGGQSTAVPAAGAQRNWGGTAVPTAAAPAPRAG